MFLIGGNLTYKILSKIINDNIDNYNYKVNELLLEIENLKLKNQENSTNKFTNNDNELLIVTIPEEVTDVVESDKVETL